MATQNQHYSYKMLAAIAIATFTMTACSKQAWYSSAQSAQQAHCMQQPISEYEDCMQPSNESYNAYEVKRQELIEENSEK